MARNDQELPAMTGEGVAPVSIRAVDNAFEELLNAREKRMSWGEKEGEASAALVKLFHKHELSVYVYDEKKYTLATIEKIKLKKKDPEENGE